MNKTVNINLAGIFFHIDEDAYSKLQRYLEAIKRSFTDSQGRSEIISDIEARIAELFSERVQNDKQVVSVKEVEEVITIMGQPEDYIVDEEIFEDEPKPRTTSSSARKLYRDTDNAYIGGVSSGLAHYFGIDALWVRLIWVALVFGAGTGVFLYILLWILIPAAQSTSEKLAMSGKPVNITNIEQKVREGFGNVKDGIEGVADRVAGSGDKVKSSSRSFFDALGNVIMFFFKVVAKFIGVLLVIIGFSTLIGLIIGLLSVGVADIFHFPGIDFANAVNSTNLPIWLVSILVLFAVGIPFFVIFLLGLKILVNNLKSIGNIAKFSLLGVWLISAITLFSLGIKEAAEHLVTETVIEKEELNVKSSDTLYVKMSDNNYYSKNRYGRNHLKVVFDENDAKMIYSSDVRLIFRSTKDTIGSIVIEKQADGRNYQDARENARQINYNYALDNNSLTLDSYLLTEYNNKFRDQGIEVIVYLPEGSVVNANENTYYFHRNTSYYNDILDNGMEDRYLKVIEDDVICLDCPEGYKVDVDVKDESSRVKIDDEGIEIKTEDKSLEINDEGLKAENENVDVTIDDEGIEIKSKDEDN